jgi:hypothetical protein
MSNIRSNSIISDSSDENDIALISLIKHSNEEGRPSLEFIKKENHIKERRIKIEVYNKGLSIFFHIFLMSIFEIIFYFGYIIIIEEQMFMNKINEYVDSVKEQYTNSVSSSSDLLITDIIHSNYNDEYLNIMYNNYQNAIVTQSQLFDVLLTRACYLSGIVGVFFFCNLCNALYYRKHIQWLGLLLENIIMFVLLGVFEYLFFYYIILQYYPVNDDIIKYKTTCSFLELFNITCK